MRVLAEEAADKAGNVTVRQAATSVESSKNDKFYGVTDWCIVLFISIFSWLVCRNSRRNGCTSLRLRHTLICTLRRKALLILIQASGKPETGVAAALF